MSVTEDTITDLLAEYLRKNGFNVKTQVTMQLKNIRKKPDLQIENGGIFFGECEWEGTKWVGLAQARDYGHTPEASGSFLVVYPEKLKTDMKQVRLGDIDPTTILRSYKYTVAFLKKSQKTDIRKVYFEEIPEWLNANIYGTEIAKLDANVVIGILQQLAFYLTKEIGNVSQTPRLFENIIGGDLDEVQMDAARNAAAYLLIHQLLFYRILSYYKKEEYNEINPDALTSPHVLNDYFAEVLKEGYSPVFSFGLAKEFTDKSLELIKTAIKTIDGLTPEYVDFDIIGKVFHNLIPYKLRKKVAAFYTKAEAAQLLSNLCIDSSNEKVFDPACGSGTLLVSAYQRKKNLLQRRKRNFESEDHINFLKEITGIDTMPFSAHLSTIHLALQAPLYKTEVVRIGIEDSTKLNVGSEIKPLQRILPIARIQRSITDYTNDIDVLADVEKEKVDAGSLDLDAKPGEVLKLDYVDLVIMNPPFTRQETIKQFTSEYKDELSKRFSEYEDLINKKMSFCSYFLFLADKFLKEGGKIAAVLPATILNKDTDDGLRRMIFDNYDIKYIIIRSDALNFSESTTLREILLIAEKRKTLENCVNYVLLNHVDGDLYASIKYNAENLSQNQDYENDDFKLLKVKQSTLDPNNLFKPISVSDSKLLRLWENLEKNDKLALAIDIDLRFDEGIRSRKGGKFPEAVIVDENIKEVTKRDIWKTKKANNILIEAKNRFTGEVLDIPRDSLIPCVRNNSGRMKIDLTNLNEFILYKNFKKSEQFMSLSDLTQNNLSSQWQAYLRKRQAHLGIVETLHIEAPGTHFFAYYSEIPRVFGSSFWNITNISAEDAKIVTLWLNSALNYAQLFLEQIPTGWFKIRGYVFNKLLMISPDKLRDSERELLLYTFDELKSIEFPCIWAQLAMNVDKNKFPYEIDDFSNTFSDFKERLGKGFEPRIKLDSIILNTLGYTKNKQDILDWLYASLLNEIHIRKKINRVD